MKKQIILITLLSIISFYSCKERIVYKDKPQANDSDIVFASAKLIQWKGWFKSVYFYQSKMFINRADSVKMKTYADSLQLQMKGLETVLQDSNINASLKK